MWHPSRFKLRILFHCISIDPSSWRSPTFQRNIRRQHLLPLPLVQRPNNPPPLPPIQLKHFQLYLTSLQVLLATLLQSNPFHPTIPLDAPFIQLNAPFIQLNAPFSQLDAPLTQLNATFLQSNPSHPTIQLDAPLTQLNATFLQPIRWSILR